MAHVDQFIPITQAKTHFLDLVRRLQKQQDAVAITKDGVPTAVLLSMDHFEGMMETIDILSDRKTMSSLRRSMKQAQAGKWVDSKAAFGDENE